jgi:hypothetical protein
VVRSKVNIASMYVFHIGIGAVTPTYESEDHGARGPLFF